MVTPRFTPDCDPDPAALLAARVEAGPPEQSYGRKEALEAHLDMLAREFSGQPVLGLYHASLIVFIRRDLNARASATRFLRLWSGHADALLGILSSRWLVSACDTLLDLPQASAEDQAGAALGTAFANTVKLYETERVVTGMAGRGLDDVDTAAVQGLCPLYDGMTAFRIGEGEMIAQMLSRLDRALAGPAPGKRIARTLIARAKAHDTVYRRLSLVHQDPNTRW